MVNPCYGHKQSVDEDKEDAVDLVQVQAGLGVPPVRVDHLGERVAVAGVGHRVLDPGLDQPELLQ